RCHVVRDDDTIVGYRCIWEIAGEIHFTNIAIHPAHRRRGIARDLLSGLIAEARARDLRMIVLEVRPSNHQAIALYESFNFRVTGRRRGYYYDTGEDALVMETRLATVSTAAGGRRYDGPFGTVYSSNITPDRETGIGSWTDEQIVTATRLGRRSNGERLLPVHPYPVFNGMAAEDLKALVAFLRSVPPVKRANQPKRIAVPLFESVFLPAWLAAFAPRETPPSSAPTAGVPRGEYLVRAVAHCGECHTPRTLTMAT